jgi:spermidine synthase
MKNPSLVRLLQICVFLSGGVALILEAVYQKYLATLIGSTTPAATIVLAVYFVGLTLGALLCPKKTARANLRLAGLELIIAGWSLVLSLCFYPSYQLLAGLLAAWSDHPFTLGLARWLIAALWILPPTIAMGAHLPTLAGVLEERGLATSRLLTRLYAINVAGACFFTLATPFLLFQPLGLEGALYVSAALGLAVSLALFLGLRRPAQAAAAPPPDSSATTAAESVPATAIDRWPFALAALSGFVVFALEVLWTHLISSVLGASTYSFSILLAVVLFSLFMGGRQVERAAPAGLERSQAYLARMLGILLVALPLTGALWPYAGRALAIFGGRLESFWAGELLKLAAAYLLIRPVARPAGTIFPLSFHALSSGRAPSSRQLGFFYAINAFGCVAGALLTNYAIIPALGAELGFKLIWGLLLAAWGLLVFARRGQPLALTRAARIVPIAGVALAALLGPWDRLELTSGFGVYFVGNVPRGAKLVSFREDEHTGFTTVVEAPQPNQLLGRPNTLYLFNNGKFDADDNTQMPAQVGFGLLPAFFSTGRERALVIGLGSGQTAATTLSMGYRQVDVCDLSPGNAEAARRWYGHINRDLLDRPEVRLQLEDGRNYLLRSREKFDLISIEITSIWFAGASNLYSREFFELVRSRLAPGGLLKQWVQLHHLTPRELATIFATARTQFEHVEFWLAGGQGVLLASREPLVFNPEAWQRFATHPELDLERRVFADHHGDLELETMLGTRLLDAAGVRELIRRTPHVIHHDRNKWLEFQTPRYYLSKRDHVQENLDTLVSIAEELEAGRATAASSP